MSAPLPLLALATGPADQFWFVAALVGLIGALGFWRGVRHLRLGRLYQNTPTSRIRSAAQGYVEIQGTTAAMPGDPVTATLTGGRCCWFRCYVEYRDRPGRGRWSTVSRELSAALFHVSDDSGTCVISPDGALVIPSTRQVWYGPLPRPPWGPAMGRGLYSAATAKFRYTEERIDFGVPLYAVGYFKTHRGGEATGKMHEQVRDLLVEWKKDQRRMGQFDLNGDGMLDAAEWQAVRVLAQQQVRTNTAFEMPGEDVPVLCNPPDGRPYILSTVPQEQLIARKQRRAVLGFAVFVLATALVAYILTLRGLMS